MDVCHKRTLTKLLLMEKAVKCVQEGERYHAEHLLRLGRLFQSNHLSHAIPT